MTYEYVERKYGFTESQIKNWRELLGPKVLSGQQTISDRSLELLPEVDHHRLLNILKSVSPEGFLEWYQSYSIGPFYLDLIFGTSYQISDFQDWKSLLGDLVISGQQTISSRSVELFPDHHHSSLLYVLQRINPPGFSEWYQNYSVSRSFLTALQDYGFNHQSFVNWKTILGNEVLNGDQSIGNRSKQLFPKHPQTFLLDILRVVNPPGFSEWYLNYEPLVNSYQSVFETEIIKLLNDLGFRTTQFNGLPHKGQIDVYIPSRNIGFELNGYYFHSLGHEDSSTKGHRLYHSLKTTQASKLRIKLFHLWYDNSYEDRTKLLESFIKSKLGIFNKKYFARKLQLREVPPSIASDFYQTNHLQGSPSKVGLRSLGLYDGDLLVSCLSFTKNPDILIRYANLMDTTVVGGFSRLFKHSIELFNLHNIVTWGNRDIIPDPLHNVYMRHGFQLLNQSSGDKQLQMQYYLPKRVLNFAPGVYSRRSFQKKKLLELFPEELESLSETDIAIKHGIFPCYNSGTWKFLYPC